MFAIPQTRLLRPFLDLAALWLGTTLRCFSKENTNIFFSRCLLVAMQAESDHCRSQEAADVWVVHCGSMLHAISHDSLSGRNTINHSRFKTLYSQNCTKPVQNLPASLMLQQRPCQPAFFWHFWKKSPKKNSSKNLANTRTLGTDEAPRRSLPILCNSASWQSGL